MIKKCCTSLDAVVYYLSTQEMSDHKQDPGGLAQLGEHLPYKQRVSGSSPLTSTMCRLSSIGRATDL